MGSDLLRTSGLKLGLITNGSIRMQSRKLQCLALSPLFDTILISQPEGISKPDGGPDDRGRGTRGRAEKLRRRLMRHAVGVSVGCAFVSQLHVALGVLPGPTFMVPSEPSEPAVRPRDVRVHGPPFDNRSPRAARLSLPTPDHLTGVRRSSVSSKNRGPFYDDAIPGLYLDGCGRSAIASTRVWPRPNGREVVELILRDGPQAQAIRAESEVTRREQLARLAYPNPSIIYSRESAGFTEFLQPSSRCRSSAHVTPCHGPVSRRRPQRKRTVTCGFGGSGRKPPRRLLDWSRIRPGSRRHKRRWVKSNA